MATVVDSQRYSQALLFKWEVLKLSLNVNRWRSHRIVMITLIISEALDDWCFRGAVVCGSFMTYYKRYSMAKWHICDYD